jgi:hypothetical protein
LSSGLNVVNGTSSRSAASEGVYSSAITAFEVESTGVEMSGKDVPAWGIVAVSSVYPPWK